MRKSVVLSAMGLAAALVVSGFGHEVVAQSGLQIGGRRSNYGSISLRPGFVPDPRSVSVVAGGTIDARSLNLGAGCVGYVTRQPDYILRLQGTSANLRVYVVVPGASPASNTDTTLIINTANGQWRCNDDSYGGANPSVDLPNAGPGQYDIWVGSYVQGANARGRLYITELSSNHP
jgi:hypothetical protein